MIEIRQTDKFSSWLRELRDSRARARIVLRMRRMAFGNLGDVKPVGEGISEMRIDYGPGYRAYLIRERLEIILLLCGGDKDTQSRDIATAKELAKAFRECPP